MTKSSRTDINFFKFILSSFIKLYLFFFTKAPSSDRRAFSHRLSENQMCLVLLRLKKSLLLVYFSLFFFFVSEAAHFIWKFLIQHDEIEFVNVFLSVTFVFILLSKMNYLYLLETKRICGWRDERWNLQGKMYHKAIFFLLRSNRNE